MFSFLTMIKPILSSKILWVGILVVVVFITGTMSGAKHTRNHYEPIVTELNSRIVNYTKTIENYQEAINTQNAAVEKLKKITDQKQVMIDETVKKLAEQKKVSDIAINTIKNTPKPSKDLCEAARIDFMKELIEERKTK
jgi:uncharacterized membrane protein